MSCSPWCSRLASLESSSPDPQPPEKPAQSPRADHGPLLLTALMMLGVAWLISSNHPLLHWSPGQRLPWQTHSRRQSSNWVADPLPLEMEGGDPYLRALMRTISAAESNTDAPYNVLYGGETVADLSQHPDLCITIVTGPNMGDCTTAAGRYQFLTTTWDAKAAEYHPRSSRWSVFRSTYSFEPVYQDQVVYRWLSDSTAWGVDIPAMLRQDRLNEVLEMLSGTWTSLGYGIEDNSTTPYLAQIYQTLLEQELNGG